MKDTDSDFLRRQAELCITLSRSTFDLTVAERLRALASTLRARADERDDSMDGFPMRPHALRNQRSVDADPD